MEKSEREVFNLYGCAEVLPGRRVGNSTRQVDIAIQELFKGKVVVCHDHARIVNANGRDVKQNLADDHLWRMVLNRLRFEHYWLFMRSGVNGTQANVKTHEIWLDLE